MRPSTEIVLGIRNVGDREGEIILDSMTVEEALERIINEMMEQSMVQRFQIAIGRDKNDVLVGLGVSKNTKEAKRRQNAESIAERMRARIGQGFVE